MQEIFRPAPGSLPRCVVLMSGTGSNARAVLNRLRQGSGAFSVEAIVTDAPETSQAKNIGEEYGIPVRSLDIRAFYLERGEESTRLDTPRRRAIREEWSAALVELLRGLKADFLLLAGFISLTNAAGKFPSLNVHPGDLRVRDGAGGRMLAGLHVRPVERAILAGHPSLRSSVILVQPYEGNARGDVDAGPILGISGAVPVELEGHTLPELQAIADARTSAPFRDALRRLALDHIERLKTDGDHVVFPRVAEDFARGRFALEGERLFFRNDAGTWVPVETVEYTTLGAKPLPAR